MELNRRSFLSTALAGAAASAIGLGLAGTSFASATESTGLEPLPAPEVDETSEKGADKNINMATIDQYLGRSDVAYRDVRHLYKTDEMGNKVVDLAACLPGFKIVPYIYIAPMGADSVSGTELFSLEWDADGNIVSATPRYKESEMIVEDLFPRDMPIFLMCTSGGRASLTKKLLTFLGWDTSLLYNIGGDQDYTGSNKVELIVYSEEHGGDDTYAIWRADYADINPDMLHLAE
jgi:hypothetical protein